MFGRILGKSKSKPPSPGRKLNSAISTSILNVVGARSIPSMPGAAQKAFALATDPNAEAREFVDVIESDEALSARIIKIANSVFFDRGSRPSTIEESLTVIGLNEIRSLLNASALAEIFPSKNLLRSVLWSNDIATALIARTLAQRFAPSNVELAFLGGLMHDVGKLLLLQRCPEEYARVFKFVEVDGLDFVTAEERRFPFTHVEVGQLIAEQWHFAPDLVSIISDHHLPWPEATQATPSIALIVKCADLFAHALGLGHTKGLNRFRLNAENQIERAWDILGIPLPERKPLLENFSKTYLTEFELYNHPQSRN